MRNNTVNKWLLAAGVLLMPLAANAAGLGKLTVLSALGQPFSAEIDLVSVTRDELSTLSVNLASPEAYRQANLQYVTETPSLRASVEKRRNGQAYVKLTSTRRIDEPFLDLLVELNWASGRLVREYTALLDPPGYGSSPAAPPVSQARAAAQTPPPAAERIVESAPAASPAPASAPAEYGPIRRGQTMGEIARELKPEGVTLEQMLIGLVRSNPDAFIRHNVNLVKAGRILRVPEKATIEAIPQSEAVAEYHAQVADWNAYRRQLADAAGTASGEGSATSGKITTRVDDAASAEPKDVVKLSRGEPPAAGGASGSTAERIRTLEEEAVARGKALEEANERIAQLEKTIRDLQRLAAIKNPVTTAAEPQAAATPSSAQQVAKTEAPAPAVEIPAAAPASQAASAGAQKAPEPKAAEPKPAKAKAPPAPKIVPPPAAESPLMDTVMENLPLLAGGLAVLLALLGLVLARRRRKDAAADGLMGDDIEPALGGGAAAEWNDAAPEDSTFPNPKATGEDVDPLAEAEIYVAHGRDVQAEEVLTEAMARDPMREDVQIKLLEIYAARKDKVSFGKLAQGVKKLTGGEGAWLKVAGMGYALDPDNALYEAGRALASSPMVVAGGHESDFEFDLDALNAGRTATDLEVGTAGVAQEGTTTMLDHALAEQVTQAQPLAEPDFSLDVPQPGATTTDISFDVPEQGVTAATDIALDAGEPAQAGADANTIDFNVELPQLGDAPAAEAAPKAESAGDAGAGMDFKLDLGDISLNLDEPAGGAAAGGSDAERDTHWYDVQTKFDLAKAYQEMGDKAGAREILEEVIKEGDAEQQAEAKKVLDALG